MPNFEDSNRIFIFASFISVFVVAGIISDIKFHSRVFMNDNEIKVVKFNEDNEVKRARSIASSSHENFKFLAKNKISFYQLDEKIINGEWLIYNVIERNGKARKVNYNENFQLIKNKDNTAAVKLKRKNAELNFDKIDILILQSSLPDSIIIFLIEKIEKIENESNFRIYEARKIFKKIKKLDIDNGKLIEQNVVVDKEVEEEKKEDFILTSVLLNDKSRNNKNLTDDNISGNLKLIDGKIEYLSAKFSSNNSDEINFEIKNSEIVNNYFQYYINNGLQAVSGVLNRSGEDEYIVSLINGPLAGTKLKFLAEKKLLENNENNENNEDNVDTNYDEDGIENHIADEEKAEEANRVLIQGNSVSKKFSNIMDNTNDNKLVLEENSDHINSEVQDEILFQRYEQTELAAELSNENVQFQDELNLTEKGFEF